MVIMASNNTNWVNNEPRVAADKSKNKVNNNYNNNWRSLSFTRSDTIEGHYKLQGTFIFIR